MVEFALAAPVLFILVLGTIELGRFIFFYELLNTVFPTMRERARHGDAEAKRWVELFADIGARLSVAVT